MEKIKLIIIGIFFIFVGIVPIWLEKDITVALLMFPLGIFVLYVAIFQTNFKTDK